MRGRLLRRFLVAALFLTLASTALASTTWYVNGVSGSDNNDCKSRLTACKTIGHAISLASSGDSIMVAAATYRENLTIAISLRLTGSGATTTIIDGKGAGRVITIPSTGANVILSNVTIQNGLEYVACSYDCHTFGGGIYNSGILTVSNSTVENNEVRTSCSQKNCYAYAYGGGIFNQGTLTVRNSTLAANVSRFIGTTGHGFGIGGGISNIDAPATATITNSTVSGNFTSGGGGGIANAGDININSTTVSGNTARAYGGGMAECCAPAVLQNTIFANNSGGNCDTTMTSKGYNLSSDSTCNFTGPGDLNNTDPQLGPLQYNGGPTQTMALPSGSPAVDAGNPNGCTDSNGNLLKIDQRGKPRPDAPEDTGGCDIGAYERQSD